MRKTVLSLGIFVFICTCPAATLETKILVQFDGTLAGSSYTLAAGEVDTTGTFAPQGSPVVSGNGSAVLSGDTSANDGFYFDGAGIVGTDSFIMEANLSVDENQSTFANFFDVCGNMFARYYNGSPQFGYWDGSSEPKDSFPSLTVGQIYHVALVWDETANKLELFLDGSSQGSVSGGNLDQAGTMVTFGNFNHSGAGTGRGLNGTLDAVAFSTYTGTIDPASDFALYDDTRLVVNTNGGLEVREGIDSDTYTLKLSRQPLGDVTVQISDTSEPQQVTTDFVSIMFSDANWDVPKTVTVTPVADGDEDDIHGTTLRHVISSAADPDYDAMADVDLGVTIYDDACGQWGYMAADLNRDCQVNLQDLAQMAFEWATCTRPFMDGCIDLNNDGSQLAKPTGEQVLWHDYEVGMFIHYSINTYLDMEWDTPADMDNLVLFNPQDLDTDEWVAAAEAMGAGYIVFVAKHVGGFCMWQTDTSDYSIKNTPYQNGNGDVLAELVASCNARNMPLGVYISPQDRFFGAGVGGNTFDPADQETYNATYRAQLTEVLRDYGPFMEVWFDGNIVAPVNDILAQYAPNAMIFQCPGGAATIRWVGNENGTCPYPGWNAVPQSVADAGTGTAADGTPDGDAWIPNECDARIRNTWFWRTDNAGTLKSVSSLMNMYYNSVGHGAVLLLNMTPDPTGAFPAADVARAAEFGQEVKRRFSQPIAETFGEGYFVTLDLPEPNTINHVITMEDITQGERVREYVIEGLVGGIWQTLASGTAIGHKKIDTFSSVDNVTAVRIRTMQAAATPIIRQLAVYNTDASTYEPPIHPWQTADQWYPDHPATGTDWYVWDIDVTAFVNDAATYELLFEKTSGTDDIEIQTLVFVMDGVERVDLVTELSGQNYYRITVPGIADNMLLRATVRGSGGSSSYGDVKLRLE